jgi:hypothetical protein
VKRKHEAIIIINNCVRRKSFFTSSSLSLHTRRHNPKKIVACCLLVLPQKVVYTRAYIYILRTFHPFSAHTPFLVEFFQMWLRASESSKTLIFVQQHKQQTSTEKKVSPIFLPHFSAKNYFH